MDDDFHRFEHEGWQRVADKYDSVWSPLTRQFISPLLAAAGISKGMLTLDVACGPGYVSAAVKELGGVPTGIDFSDNMVAIAKGMFPGSQFLQGDAHELPFTEGNFDCVLMNFGLLHVSNPEKACAEACRVLKRGGKFGFTVWAGPEQNPGAKIVNDALEAYADLDVGLPEGPPKYLYGDREECRQVLERVGFDGASMNYKTCIVEWHHPHAGHYFEAERNAGVRTAGILGRQSPETLEKIRIAMEERIKEHARGDKFVLPMAANVVVVAKKQSVAAALRGDARFA
jgi:ubiquinone/menaquinone biosynthesis C-methylase UbiE